MKTVLVTGGAGFFGRVLKSKLLAQGARCVSIDLQPDPDRHENLISFHGDLRDESLILEILTHYSFEEVYHCATLLGHAVKNENEVWNNNIDSTRAVAEFAKKCSAKSLVYLSTNCLWAKNFHRPVVESDQAEPIEVYGRSKLEGEKILREYMNDFGVTVIRTPTIISEERLGLLSILFEFIREGRVVWMVGQGNNRYQFIYSDDLADACILAAKQSSIGHYEIFNVGSDNVASLRDVFKYVISRAESPSKIRRLPKLPMILAMRMAYFFGISPLGPYHYSMIGEDFSFDTGKIKSQLGWKPSLTNEEMLWKAYLYYRDNYQTIEKRTDVSAHRKPVKMGVIRLLKWFS